MAKTNTEKQATYWEKQRKKGMKRILAWVPEDKADDYKLIMKSPHAVANAKKKIIAELTEEMKQSDRIRLDVERTFRATTQAAFLEQARTHSDRLHRKERAPPPRIAFPDNPPGFVDMLLQENFWYYDPVSQCWFRPTNPTHWNNALLILHYFEENNVPYIPLKLDPHHTLEDVFRETQQQVDRASKKRSGQTQKKPRRNIRRR